MNSWYYSQADQDVGPFQTDVLSKLVRVGVIDDATPVRKADETDWHPLATVLPKEIPPAPIPIQEEARYYYLDATDQPVGPFDVAALKRLHAEKVLGRDTFVSCVGDLDWVPAARLLSLPPPSPSATRQTAGGAPEEVRPRFLPFERYVRMMAATLSFYTFYLIPCQSRDMKAITGRERMEFTVLLILGIVTASLVLLVMQVLWAFDLERHGKSINKVGRREALGTLVLVPTAHGVVLSFAIDNSVVGFLIGAFLNCVGLWLLQNEINLYAKPSAAFIT